MRGNNNNNSKNNPRKIYSANPNNYKLLEEVGHGASATVFRAIYLPLNEVVAVKCLDLDRCNSNFDEIRREAQTMHLIDHPNVVRSYCSFVVERSLWVIMPFMAEGSCLHLMKIAYPDGFEEVVMGSILKETLKALVYLHQQGHIHRDVKAGNILLDTNGMVKLADFGVSACMFDAGDRRRSRNTFTGTPCWMAPEVLQPGSGYNSKANIWSFGITALELAHGHAPFSKYPPMKVLLMTIQNAPPGLDYDRDKKFSKAFKEMVATCLVKDQTKRPTAEKLLKHSFFKTVKPPEFSLRKLFTDLPPLWTRVKSLQAKDAAQLALKKMPSAEQEAMSQSEYQRGVSAWNFDVEDLKAQASLVRDDDNNKFSDIINDEEKSKGFSYKVANDWKSSLGKLNENNEGSSGDFKNELNSDDLQQVECSNIKGKHLEDDLPECGSQLAIDHKDGSSSEALVSTSVTDMGQAAMPRVVAVKSRQSRSGPLTPGSVLNHSLSDAGRNPERHGNENQSVVERAKAEVKRTPSFSGPLMLPNRASANSFSAPIKSSGGYRDSLDDKSKVQIKGRFSVTSENLDLVKDIPSSTAPRQTSQGSPLRKSASIGDWVFDSRQMPGGSSPKELNNSSDVSASLISHLQNHSQQLFIQQDMIINVLSVLQPMETVEAVQNGKLPPVPRSSENNGNVEPVVSVRERLLLLKISELQLRMNNSNDELASERMRETQLKQQLDALSEQEENGDKR